MDSYNYNYPVDAPGMSDMPDMSEIPAGVTTEFPAPEAGMALAGLMGGIFLFNLIFVGIFYVYFAICLMKIAQKTNTNNAWFAWVPILNIVLMLQVAKKPVWWLILLFIPLVNIIVSVIVWMGISKALGKEEWLGILIIVPIANIIIPGYLAFSQKTEKPAVEKGTPA